MNRQSPTFTYKKSKTGLSKPITVSDNIHSQHQKAVYGHFQTLLDSGARSYTFWKELEATVTKGVFRSLRLPEPFPKERATKVDQRKQTPYSIPVPESPQIVPLLSPEEKTQLDAVTRVRAAHTAAQEAELKAKLILEDSQIRKEKERLRL
ncbi:hypothetical protein GHT06_018695 [Daphnia sinensis]|uniref:Uncharacterized protein n=1 Tax=Daphnia sinensis TaxID=1820382 RepID=A0AAD5KMV5_9CRUS|nr:hypothetical protein GHT06_018695 [Daphnia sinensis]